MLKRILGLLVIALAGLHGFFYLSYGTLDPCKAAAHRVVDQQQSGAVRDLGRVFSGQLESVIRSKGALECYRIAVAGEDPANLVE